VAARYAGNRQEKNCESNARRKVLVEQKLFGRCARNVRFVEMDEGGCDVSFLHLVSSQSIVTIVFSTVVATAVSWFFGPMLAVRQEKARRSLELRRSIQRHLEPLERDLRRSEAYRLRLEQHGRGTLRLGMIQDYDRLLWPVVRSLDNPDLSRRLAKELEIGLLDLLGRWGFAYLSTRELGELDMKRRLDALDADYLLGEERESLLFDLAGQDAGSTKIAEARARRRDHPSARLDRLDSRRRRLARPSCMDAIQRWSDPKRAAWLGCEATNRTLARSEPSARDR
jgi:hypothetical protein